MIERLDERAYARGRFRYYAVLSFPMWSLAVYGAVSLILFQYSPDYRDFVDSTPIQVPWLTSVFPILDGYASALERRHSPWSLGYVFHLYSVVLITTGLALFWQIATWRTMRRFTFARISRDRPWRGKFRDAEHAFARLFLGALLFAACLLALRLNWDWSGRRSSSSLYGFLFPVYGLPMLYGGSISCILAAVQSMSVVLARDARNLKWGAEALSEGRIPPQ